MDLVKMKMAAGLRVSASDFVSKSTPDNLFETAKVGKIGTFWLVVKPRHHKATLPDVLVEITNLVHFAHWIHQVNQEGDDASKILKSTQMFYDHVSAKHRAEEMIVKAISDHDTTTDKQAAKDKPDTSVKSEEAEEIVKDSPENITATEYGLGESEEDLTESINYYDDASPESWSASDRPANSVKSSDKDVEDAFSKSEEPKAVTAAKIRVPAALKSQLNAVIADLKKDFQKAAIHDRNATGYYPTAIEVMEELLDYLNGATIDDIKHAQIKVGTLSGAFLHKIPADVLLFITNGGESKSLKDIFAKVSQK